MARLIDDRYFADGSSHAWDLATGQIVPADAPRTAGAEDVPPLATLVELLEQGQDGAPRWLDVPVDSGAAKGIILRAAADGQTRGFVPVDVDLYFTLRDALEDVLRDRALLLIGRRGVDCAARGWMALLDAAARSPRPHVLLTFRVADRARLTAVRETRAAYQAGAARAVRDIGVVDADEQYQLHRAARARTFIRAGRHAAAERLLRDVAGALTRRSRAAAACRVSIELGQMILERGRASDADRAFEQAAEMASAARDEMLMAEARTWQAIARADAGRLADAESLCRAVLSGKTLDCGSRVRTRAALARVLLWQRRGAEAAVLDLDLADGHGLEAPAAVRVGAVAVRVLIAEGRLFEAGLRARHLLASTIDGDAAARLTACAAHLQVLVGAGDLTLAHQALEEIRALAKAAHLPIRAARARLVWARALHKAGRKGEARLEAQRLQRLSAAGPALFRRAVKEVLRAIDEPRARGAGGEAHLLTDASPAVKLVTLAHDEEDDRESVRRALELVAGITRTSRIDVCSMDAGPVSTAITVGGGLPTRLGGRVLDAGVALGPERVDGGCEMGVPVRRGVRLFAAIVGRWPADRTPPPGAIELLELAAAVVCPRLECILSAARASAAAVTSVPELIGSSAAIADVRSAIARAAAAPFAVLIQGESGVGKELVARAIHQLSPRRERRFCDVNCAALPDDLIESELFGHARGAFTGAVTDRPGLFEDADGGTVFLDELADLSLRAQAKLLRVLQQQEVRRVGETFSRKVDVRLVTAANRDMSLEAESGRFRQDLLYRLDVIRIRIPPLRERPGDVALLAAHFWRSAAARVGTAALLTHGVLAALSRYHWPGNVRELQNVVSALAVAAPSRGSVRAQLLPPAISGATSVTSTRMADARAQFERRVIESALARAGDSRTRAARELGLSRQGLLKMMGRLGMG